MTPPLAFRWAVALLELPRIVAGAALDALDRRVCRLSNEIGGDEEFDLRKPGEAFCSDCPDHEACATAYPCGLVKRVNGVTK